MRATSNKPRNRLIVGKLKVCPPVATKGYRAVALPLPRQWVIVQIRVLRIILE